jgi:hypothetical protein
MDQSISPSQQAAAQTSRICGGDDSNKPETTDSTEPYHASGLLTLPPELREMIFKRYLADTKDLRILAGTLKDYKEKAGYYMHERKIPNKDYVTSVITLPALIFPCKTIHREIKPLLDNLSVVQVGVHPLNDTLLLSLPRKGRARAKIIVLDSKFSQNSGTKVWLFHAMGKSVAVLGPHFCDLCPNLKETHVELQPVPYIQRGRQPRILVPGSQFWQVYPHDIFVKLNSQPEAEH